MADKAQKQNEGLSQAQSSPPSKPQSHALKIDPAKTINYRKDGAEPK